MRKTVYCTAVRQGGVDAWMFLKNQFDIIKKSGAIFGPKNTDVVNMLKGLSCTRIPWLLVKHLHWVLQLTELKLDEQFINFQEMIKSITDNDIGKFVIYNFLQRNKKEILKYVIYFNL